jgi:4-diphosphocytidyl-2-C-methyl-D-erythritol kinase
VSPAAAIEAFAPAKVNLWLRVVGRRDDGYHLLDSLVAFAAVGDVVRAAAAETLTLAIDGPFATAVPGDATNLVLRAARALAGAAREASCRTARGPAQSGAPAAALALTKNLPPASGIGGGSADAAATLRALSALWGLDATLADRVAPTLGADVQVCLRGRPCRMQGIGERLDPVPTLPDCGIVLCNPGVPLETRTVFAARAGGFSAPFPPRPWPDASALAKDIRIAGNDLQAAATALCPPIAEVLAALQRLPGALCAQMSGSGATCFALFAGAEAARRAAAQLPPSWWRWGGAATAAAPGAAPPRPPGA